MPTVIKKIAILAVVLFPQLAFAEQYYLGMPSAAAIDVMLTHDLELPSHIKDHEGKLWGFVGVRDKDLDHYLGAATDVYIVGGNHYRLIARQCPDFSPSCVVSLFQE